MSTLDIVTFFVYLVGSVTFILGLKFLSSPVSARRGNRLAATGMAIVVAWVFITEFLLRDGGLSTVWILAVGIPVGGLVGALGARRVPMTAMPQMVAIFNGAGGGAAALVAAAEFLRGVQPGDRLTYEIRFDPPLGDEDDVLGRHVACARALGAEDGGEGKHSAAPDSTEEISFGHRSRP